MAKKFPVWAVGAAAAVSLKSRFVHKKKKRPVFSARG